MRQHELSEKVHVFNIVNLKFPPEWELMSTELKENFARQTFLKNNGQEPDNIIPFRQPQHIDLINCF